MNLPEKRETIEVWRPDDFSELELRRGYAVARPVPRHWHEEYQFCLIQSGAGELIYRGQSLQTPPASLFIVHPGEVHANRAFGTVGCSYRTIFLDVELMRRMTADIFEKEKGLPFFTTAVVDDGEIIRRYLNLHLAFEQSASGLERHTLLLDFLAKLISRFAEKRSLPLAAGLECRAITRACEYLAEHYSENVSLETLACIANLSPFHFNRVFSEQLGLPPHAFQTQLRVLNAQKLLRQGYSISSVAAQTGFADQSHFTRQFKRLTVLTPGQFIQNSKNVQDRSATNC
jgi:AraC-like DNA-binding protein